MKDSSTRFNFVGESGDGSGFALRCLQEGNEVRYWMRSSDVVQVGNGLFDKVGDFEDLLVDSDRERDVFVFDGSGNGFIADSLRHEGFSVVGGSLQADRLERDRTYGLEVMLEAGIKVPETHKFTSWEDGREFVKTFEGRLVYKPSKQLGDLSPSHVSYDREDLLEMLDNFESDIEIETPEFELQEFVPGAAFSTELWFDGMDFLPLWNHTFERKELMNDNLGPSGGCTGNVVWACGECVVCQKLRKLSAFLRRVRFHGMVDLNVIVAEKDGELYGLEFTPRFGYDASPTMFLELVEGDTAQVLADVSRGQFSFRSPHLSETLAGGIRVSIPPWPTEKYHADADVPIRGLEPRDEKHLYLYNVKSSEGKLASAGAWGILLLVTGSGDSVGRALSRPTEFCERVRIPNKQYRTDLVSQFKEDFEKLESVGIESRVANGVA